MSETGVALEQACGPTATGEKLFASLTGSEGLTRRVDRLVVGVVAELGRRGSFAQRGYRNTTTALADLAGWDRADAHRRVIAAEQARPRIGVDGSPLPAYLPRTAAVFAAGGASLRHRARRARPAAGCGPVDPGGPRRAAACGGGPGPGLRPVWAPAQLV